MLKRDYMLAIIGLSVVYALISLIAFFSRGKWSKVIQKKLTIGIMIVTFSTILTGHVGCLFPPSCYVPPPSCYLPPPTPEPTQLYETPEPEATPEPIPVYGTP